MLCHRVALAAKQRQTTGGIEKVERQRNRPAKDADAVAIGDFLAFCIGTMTFQAEFVPLGAQQLGAVAAVGLMADAAPDSHGTVRYALGAEQPCLFGVAVLAHSHRVGCEKAWEP